MHTLRTRVELNDPLTLPCGVSIPNRLVKTAMTEGLADSRNRPTPELVRLYRHWRDSGCGLQVTGNIQIDRRYLERAGNIAIDGNEPADMLRTLADEGSHDRCLLWAQVSHAGRQVNRTLWPQPVGPSAIGLGAEMENTFPVPRALTHDEILDIIERFATAAGVVRDAGFTGMQIHGAHGYLLSSFLSPLANRREDEWGGSLANRARLLLAIVRAVRAVVGDQFPVAVKLNVSDFDDGGYGFDDCKAVAGWLADAGIDLLEVSGGTHARPVMSGAVADAGVRAEAYFLEFGRALRPAVPIPLMVTGGFRSRAAIASAVQDDGIDLVGMARPYVLAADVGHRLIGDPNATIALPRHRVLWYYEQIYRLATGLDPDVTLDAQTAAAATLLRDLRQARALTGRPSPHV